MSDVTRILNAIAGEAPWSDRTVEGVETSAPCYHSARSQGHNQEQVL
jgi:hypothetical protein